MAWWLTIYLSEPLGALSGDQLLKGIQSQDTEAYAGVDYYTLAEDYELEEDEVGAALARLRFEHTGKDPPLDGAVHYQAEDDARPLVIHQWRSSARIAEELEEADQVRSRPSGVSLGGTREIVAVELGFSQLEDMGIVFALEVARYLAQKGKGFIVDDENQWFRIDDDGAFEALS